MVCSVGGVKGDQVVMAMACVGNHKYELYDAMPSVLPGMTYFLLQSRSTCIIYPSLFFLFLCVYSSAFPIDEPS